YSSNSCPENSKDVFCLRHNPLAFAAKLQTPLSITGCQVKDCGHCPSPPPDCDIFIWRIPHGVGGDELSSLVQSAGPIYEMWFLRRSTKNRHGYALVTYTNQEAAYHAVSTLQRHRLEGLPICVEIGFDKQRLIIKELPQDESRQELMEKLEKVTPGVKHLLLYQNELLKVYTPNNVFAFVDYESHQAAFAAIKKLLSDKTPLWKQNNKTQNVLEHRTHVTTRPESLRLAEAAHMTTRPEPLRLAEAPHMTTHPESLRLAEAPHMTTHPESLRLVEAGIVTPVIPQDAEVENGGFLNSGHGRGEPRNPHPHLRCTGYFIPPPLRDWSSVGVLHGVPGFMEPMAFHQQSNVRSIPTSRGHLEVWCAQRGLPAPTYTSFAVNNLDGRCCFGYTVILQGLTGTTFSRRQIFPSLNAFKECAAWIALKYLDC
uniref:probable RNA-binding protein 46 n=1 Tax=Myxine glutinosa TaxID=7769 RepID=UPI00358E3D3A